MFNFKAVIIGLVVTLLIGLCGQVAFVLLASYVGMAAEDVAWIQQYKQQFWFALGMLAYCLSLILGGMVTAFISDKSAIANATLAGGLAAVVSVLTSGDTSELTLMALLLVGLGILFGGLGGRFYQRITVE